MEQEEKILEVIRERDLVTPGIIAHTLSMGVEEVEQCLIDLKGSGRIQEVVWEKLLEMGK